jgi:hypothetical protein
MLVAPAAVIVGDFLHIPEKNAHGLVVARTSGTQVTVLMSNGEIVTRTGMVDEVFIAEKVPQDFAPEHLAARQAEREGMAKANADAAKMLWIAADAAKYKRAEMADTSCALAKMIGSML